MKCLLLGEIVLIIFIKMTLCNKDSCSQNPEECELSTEESPEHLYDPEHNAKHMQLVLFEESRLFPHHTHERIFEFVGKELVIKQDWSNVGVAGVVWDAAIVLCKYLEENSYLVENKHVIELGAGTGLVGMVAALLGSQVVITDRDVAMEQLTKNVERNLQTLYPAHKATTQELEWGNNLDKFPTYDVILGADIVYIEETFPELMETLLRLSNCDSIILLSCKIRYNRDIQFVSNLREFFDVDEIHRDKEKDNVIYRVKKLAKQC